MMLCTVAPLHAQVALPPCIFIKHFFFVDFSASCATKHDVLVLSNLPSRVEYFKCAVVSQFLPLLLLLPLPV
jgi:hypothetical protein